MSNILSFDGGRNFIEEKIASTSSTIEFSLPTGYSSFELYISNLQPSSDGTILLLRTSSDAGANFDDTGGDYSWINRYTVLNSTEAQTEIGSTSADSIAIIRNMGNATNETNASKLIFSDATEAVFTKITSTGLSSDTTTAFFMYESGGVRLEAAIVNSIQFFISSGSILTGTFKLYGIK